MKGQASIAQKLLAQLKVNLIGLAKLFLFFYFELLHRSGIK